MPDSMQRVVADQSQQRHPGFWGFLQAPLGMFCLIFLIVSCLVTGGMISNQRQHLTETAQRELQATLHLAQETIHDRMAQQESMLRFLGERLLRVHGSQSPEQVQQMIDAAFAHNPVFAAYGIALPTGELTYVSESLRAGERPNLLHAPSSRSTFLRAMESRRMVIGRTYFLTPLGKWIIPLRVAIRGPQDAVELVITTGIDLENAFNPWKIDGLPDQTLFYAGLQDIDQGKLFPLFIEQYEILASGMEEAYGNALPSGLLKLALDQARQAEPFISDNGPLPPALIAQSFDPVYGMAFGLRRELSSIWAPLTQYTGIAVALCLLFNALLLFFFYHLHRTEERLRRQLHARATHDMLTGLPNRAFLVENLPNIQQQHSRCLSILFIDLDNFKFINDHFGHFHGDEVLRRVAARLSNLIPADSWLIRLGGDEFLVLSDEPDPTALQRQAERILSELKEPILLQDLRLCISASIGIRIRRPDKRTLQLDDLLADADIALQEAKKLKDRCYFFDGQLKQKTEQRVLVEAALKTALRNHEMFLVYQPQIDLQDNRVKGVEALLRWENEELGFVPPDVFIPICESSGQIISIGEFVIRQAFADFARFGKGRNLTLAVNISAHQLIYADLCSTLLDSAAAAQVRPRDVILEITESVFIEDTLHVSQVLDELRRHGFMISLDDFGTGYSSLGTVRNLTIDELKIDRSFIQDILTDPKDMGMVWQIIELGHLMEMKILAEGVETREQAVMLEELGCDLCQGYLYAKPLAPRDLEPYLNDCGRQPGDCAGLEQVSA